MTQSAIVKECFKNLIGWKQHYNAEIVISEELQVTETGEYYQDFHPALNLNIISQSLEKGRELEEYLNTKVETGITQMFNDIDARRKAEGVKDTLANATLLNKYGWANDTIYNEGRFVGFMFMALDQIGINITLQSIGFQFSQAQELDLYVYHSTSIEPLAVKTVQIGKAIAWNWIEEAIELYSNNGDIQGGMYYIGYYQEDLTGQAINYTDFDWNKGHCGVCDGGTMKKVWQSVMQYVYIMPFYVPGINLTEDRLMFDAEAVMIDNFKSWGMNFKVGVTCDISNFVCDNKKAFKNALGNKVAHLILNDMKFSQQFNYINDEMKSLIIRDLEGDKDTYNFGTASKYNKALNDVVFDTSGLSPKCLPCLENGSGVDYGVA